MSRGLAGLRVLDLSRIIAAPLATQMLADLGAEVIKIERPGTGDDTRAWGPVYVERTDGQRSAESAYYVSANRGKRSVAIDIASADGAELVRRLAAGSDVLVENYKVGALARYGLDWATLSALNPRLIYCSVSGYGQTGPYAELPAYDLVIQGLSGFMSATGHADDAPGGGPMRSAVPFADVLAGAYAAVGILAALEDRHRTGRGQHVDVSLLESMIAAMPNVHVPYLLNGRELPRTGNSNPNVYPNEPLRCADGFIILAVANDSQFRALCGVLGAAELGTEERFATNNRRSRARAELGPILEELLSKASVEDWVARLRAAGVPCGPVNPIAKVFDDPQVKARGLAIEVRHPKLAPMKLLGNPIRFSGIEMTYERPPPTLGEDTADVMRELLGLDDAELARLRSAGVLGH